ncbi:MAG: hypothetical protein WC707_02285 [Candidatus Babeliaceae bacterium]|jgi:hypothetical protein
MKKKNLFLNTLAFLSLAAYSTQSYGMNNQELLATIGKATASVGLAGLAYASFEVVHEFGHAIANKALFKEPLNITLFDNGSTKPIAKIGGVKLQSLNILSSKSYNELRIEHSGYKEGIVSLAGPLFGIAYAMAIFKYSQGSMIKLPLAIAALASIGGEIMSLLPITIDGNSLDGHKAAHNIFGISHQTLHKISHYKRILQITATIGLGVASFKPVINLLDQLD